MAILPRRWAGAEIGPRPALARRAGMASGRRAHLPYNAGMRDNLVLDDVVPQIRAAGYAVRDQGRLQNWPGPHWPGWDMFAASWNDLCEDRYMADGGRYRRRRYAVFDVRGDVVHRAPHQPHFQARSYNRLNGGVARWFAPIPKEIATHAVMDAVVRQAAELFDTVFAASGSPKPWHVEVHQFRIVAVAGEPGLPTPEGIHRDGVDGVVVMLIGRQNVSSGVTQLFTPDGRKLGAFTLSRPSDTVFLDDTRVLHGVTPIVPLDAGQPATRDVLVVTFHRQDHASGGDAAR